MKRINDWLDIIKSEMPPSVLSGMVALGLIFFLMPTADGHIKMTLINVVRMGILCLFTSAIAYYVSLHYLLPQPFWIAVIVATFTSPISLGVFKLSVKFSRNPEKTLKKVRK